MIDHVRLAWRLLRDDRVSALKYLLPALLALYVVSPVDMIPDLLLGVGQIDDVGAIIVATMVLIRLLPKVAPAEVVAEHQQDLLGPKHERAEKSTGNGAYDAHYTVR
jgi:uncharacterized membrane protein YkvA (DUF1232 family)